MEDNLFFTRDGSISNSDHLRIIKILAGQPIAGELYNQAFGYCYDPRLQDIQTYVKAHPNEKFFLRAEPIGSNKWNFHLEVEFGPRSSNQACGRNPKRQSIYFNDLSNMFEEDIHPSINDFACQASSEITFDNDLSNLEILPSSPKKNCLMKDSGVSTDNHIISLLKAPHPSEFLNFKPSHPKISHPAKKDVRCPSKNDNVGTSLEITKEELIMLNSHKLPAKAKPEPVSQPNIIPLDEDASLDKEDSQVPFVEPIVSSPPKKEVKAKPSKGKKAANHAKLSKSKNSKKPDENFDLSRILEESLAEDEKFFYYIGKTGKKRHRDPHCGRLKNPKKLNNTNPQVQAYPDCKICC